MSNSKRNLIDEISGLKSRDEFNNYHESLQKLETLENGLKSLETLDQYVVEEFIKYIPVATVAIFQSFFRSQIKEILDLGEPYSKRIIQFNQSKNIKLDFDLLTAIQTKTFTVGELVAHLLPYNNIDDFNNSLSVILDVKFLDELKTFEVKSEYEYLQIASYNYKHNVDNVIKAVIYIFKLRHVICHELASEMSINKAELIENFKYCRLFLEQTYNYLISITDPDMPETISGMRVKASNEFGKAEEELNQLVQNIQELSDEFVLDLDLFSQSITQWKEYREIKAQSKAKADEGHSLYSLILLQNKATTTKEKIASLKSEFDFLFKQNRKNQF